MKEIDYEIKSLLEMASSGKLPSYPVSYTEGSYFAENFKDLGMSVYSSSENDVLERQLEALWAGDAQMSRLIPLVIAAVEKSRGQKESKVPHTELYNYTM